MPTPLDYDPDAPQHDARARLLRALWVVIALKVVLVVANTAGAFSGVADWLRFLGIGLQVSLTVIFLVLIFRLTTRH